MLSLPWCLEVVVIGDVRDADDEHAHPAKRTVNDAGRDVDEGTLGNRMLDAVQNDAAAAVEDVVQLGGTLVKMELGAVDVHGTRPQHVVPAGQWQAARPIVSDATGDYTLVACTVAPGFDFADFSFMADDGDEAAAMRHHWPDLASLI